MQTCSLHDFMQELEPWLDREHLKSVALDADGHLVVCFLDGMRHVYHIDDCNRDQVDAVLADLGKRGIAISK